MTNQNSISTHHTQLLDDTLYQLISQWPIDQGLMAGKRKQLEIFLGEVGEDRFKHAIQRTIETYSRDYFPPVGWIRNQVNSYLDNVQLLDRAARARVMALPYEFNRFIRDLRRLEDNRRKRPEEKVYFTFQHSRIAGIFHYWLVPQHQDYIAKLPDDLAWVADEKKVLQYVADSPAPRRP